MTQTTIAAFPAALALCLALALALAPGAAPAHPGHERPPSRTTPEERLARGIEGAEKRLAQDPENLVAISQMASLYLKRGEIAGAHADFAKAAALYRRHLELKPASAGSHFGLARSLAGRHRFREALEEAEEASRLLPNEEPLKVYVGDCHFWLGEYELAEPIYLAAHHEDDLTLESLSRLAQVAEARGRDAQALAHWSDARAVGEILSAPPVNDDPASFAWATTMLGDFWLERGRPEAAEALFRESLALAPDSEAAQWRLARSLARQDKSQEAYGILFRLAGRRERAEYWFDLARAAQALGMAEEADAWAGMAESFIVEAWERDHELGHVRYLVEYWTEKEINLDRAAEFALMDLEARGDIGALQTAAWALHKAGRTAEALPLAERALAPGSRKPRLARQMAAIFEAAGQPGRAEQIRGEAKAMLDSLPPPQE